MKNLIIAFLFAPLLSVAQKIDTLKIIKFSESIIPDITYMDDIYLSIGKGFGGARVSVSKDSVYLRGDTLEIIKLLIDSYQVKDSLNRLYLDIIEAGVDWSNNVPDYYKTKKHEWPLFQKYINAIGYKTIIRKPKK